jgi:hypothetical protein
MLNPIFESWQSSKEMMDAEMELIAMGDGAVPLLRDFFTGTAKNAQGVAYRNMPLPLRCALEVCCRLGPLARPLEGYLIAELEAGHWVAASALESLGEVSEEAIKALAANIDPKAGPNSSIDLAFQSAQALARLGATQHPSVLQAVEAFELKLPGDHMVIRVLSHIAK